MSFKSLKYYRRTVLLKLAALSVHTCGRLGLLEFFKEKNRHSFEGLWSDDFSESVVGEQATCPELYIGYCYLRKPSDLSKHLAFNENGVAQKRSDVPLDYHNPLITAWYGLLCWNHFVETKNRESLADFWRQARFLREFGEEKQSAFWLYYRNENPRHQLKPPWASGLTQAVGVSLFLRAWQGSGEEHWLDLARKTFNSLFIPVAEGGVFSQTDGFDWIEERPAEPFDRALCGYLFCLIAIYEFIHRVEDSCENRLRLQSLLKSLFFNLHRYVFGKFTRYSLQTWQFSNIEYQGLFVYLFLHLHQLSGKPAFLKLAFHFDKHTDWAGFNEFYQIRHSKPVLSNS